MGIKPLGKVTGLPNIENPMTDTTLKVGFSTRDYIDSTDCLHWSAQGINVEAICFSRSAPQAHSYWLST